MRTVTQLRLAFGMAWMLAAGSAPACAHHPAGSPAGSARRTDLPGSPRESRLQGYLLDFLSSRGLRGARLRGIARAAMRKISSTEALYLIERTAVGRRCRRFKRISSYRDVGRLTTYQGPRSNRVAHRFRYRIHTDRLHLTALEPWLYVGWTAYGPIPRAWQRAAHVKKPSPRKTTSYRIRAVEPRRLVLSGGTWFLDEKGCRAALRRREPPFDLRGQSLRVGFRRPWRTAPGRDYLRIAMRRKELMYWAVPDDRGRLHCQSWRFEPGRRRGMGRITRLLQDGVRQYYPYYYSGTYISLDGPRHEHPKNKKHMYPDVLCSADLVVHAVGPRRILLDRVDLVAGIWYLSRRVCRKALQRAARKPKPTTPAARRRAARPLRSPATCGSG